MPDWRYPYRPDMTPGGDDRKLKKWRRELPRQKLNGDKPWVIWIAVLAALALCGAIVLMEFT